MSDPAPADRIGGGGGGAHQSAPGREAVAAVRVAVRRDLAALQPGDLVLVACSGGPDSMSLADAVSREAERAGVRAGAVVVDHGLQPGSAATSAAVVESLRGSGFDPVLLVRVDPARYPGGPESAARTARYAAFESAAADTGAAAVLLAHTRDDQAETVLLGLARGSGARSLAGMPAIRGLYRRPLLGLPRATVHAALDPAAPVVRDPHNTDPAYARSRVRSRVLPVLEAELGPGIAAALARSARLLRADADALDEWAERAALTLGSAAGLDLAGLTELPVAVRSRVLRRAAISAGCPASALTAEHVEALDALVTAWRGQGAPALPGGVRAERACGRLALHPPADPALHPRAAPVR